MDDTARIDAVCGLVNAIGNSDWQGVAALLAENFRYIELGTGRTLDGPQAFIDAMSGWKGAFPDVRGTLTNVMASGQTVAVELVWAGTHEGALEGLGRTIGATGIHQSTPAALFVVFDDDRIVETRQYFDMVGLYKQIGALP